jgi:heparan-alpha-glucosaminide N-acetyltransferase
VQRVPDKLEATKKAVLRALKLFCLGLVLQGGFFHGVRSLTFGVDITKIRLMGILQVYLSGLSRIYILYLTVYLLLFCLTSDKEKPKSFWIIL